MQTSTLTITPAKAKIYLDKNTTNRPIRKSHVTFLSSEITNDNWEVNGESIKIAKGGEILDGQHRLLAICDAKKSIKTVVMTGLDPSVFDTIDTGINRTGGDVFSLLGEKNCNTLSALLKSLLRYYDYDWKRMGRVSNSELEKVLERFPESRDIVSMHELKAPGLLPGRVIHFCYSIFRKKNKDQALEFMTRLCNGNDLPARSPIMTLRNKIMEAKLKGTAYHPDTLILLTFKAWNLYRDGKTAGRITWKVGEVMEKAR